MTITRSSPLPWIWFLLYMVVILIIVTLQLKLWQSDWSLTHAEEIYTKIIAQKESNKALKYRNSAIAADVADLKQGYESIEERARTELGMIKQDEIFYQLITE